MACSLRVWLFLAASLSVGVAGWTFAQPAMPTVDEILKVWRDRQAKVKSVRFDLDTERTISKGLLNKLIPPRRGESTEPNPPDDVVIAGSETVSLAVQMTRQSILTQQWDPTDKSLYAETFVQVYDGRVNKSLRDPASNHHPLPDGDRPQV
jgi:hypothetical protein